MSENKLRAAFCLLIFYFSIQTGFADILEFNDDDTVTITAERAWEADEGDVIHFSGQFELRAPDWYLSADSVVVYGKLDNPDKVVLEGKPAKIRLLRDAEKNSGQLNSKESVAGAASKIEYFRTTNKLVMRGGATLKRKDDMVTGEIIEYDIDADHYSASGAGRISTHIDPGD